MRAADDLLFRIEFDPAFVERMTAEDMVHYIGRFNGWYKRQPKAR
jgi:hypothetical protein